VRWFFGLFGPYWNGKKGYKNLFSFGPPFTEIGQGFTVKQEAVMFFPAINFVAGKIRPGYLLKI
jgi:hypothetical protein